MTKSVSFGTSNPLSNERVCDSIRVTFLSFGNINVSNSLGIIARCHFLYQKTKSKLKLKTIRSNGKTVLKYLIRLAQKVQSAKIQG